MRAVYATDLSDAIETAISSQTCLECLGRYGIEEIDLLTVQSPNVHSGVVGGGMSKQRERAFARQQEVLESEGFEVHRHVARGTPHRRINGLADQVDANLIVIGSRGQSPLEERFIGSTARNMARTTVRPLLVTRIHGEDSDHAVAREHLFERVLYATDFSENAEHAFEQFDALQTPTKEALLMHAVGPEQRTDGAEADSARERLRELAADLDGLGIDADVSVRTGQPVEQILAAADEYQPSTVLIGARGLSRMRRLLLGSVSEKVVAQTDSNVLLVPPRRVR